MYLDERNNSGRFSGAIWASMPTELYSDPNLGVYRAEDFANFGLSTPVATNVGYYVGRAGPYKSYEDSSASIVQKAAGILSRIALNTAATNNNEVWLQSNSSVGILGKIATSTSGRKLWFETRIATHQIVTQNFFAGLSEEGLAAADTQADSGGAFASKDMIGFQVNESTPSKLDFVYRCAGQALQTPATALVTLVADTFVNVGFIFDPREDSARRITLYVNGVKQTTFVTKANIAAATFPESQGLAYLIGGKNNNADCTFYSEGWRFGQLYDPE